MDELSETDLIREGFQVNNQDGNSYQHLEWEPKPEITFLKYNSWGVLKTTISARIGSMQWKLKNQDDLKNFMCKAVPTFCEPI